MLDSLIQELAGRAPGFRGVAVVGMDGVPLVKREADGGPDMDLCAAEYATLIRSLQGLSSHEGAGKLRGLVTRLQGWNLLAEKVTDEYFLVLVMATAEPLGRGRYELGRAALRLQPELV